MPMRTANSIVSSKRMIVLRDVASVTMDLLNESSIKHDY